MSHLAVSVMTTTPVTGQSGSKAQVRLGVDQVCEWVSVCMYETYHRCSYCCCLSALTTKQNNMAAPRRHVRTQRAEKYWGLTLVHSVNEIRVKWFLSNRELKRYNSHSTVNVQSFIIESHWKSLLRGHLGFIFEKKLWPRWLTKYLHINMTGRNVTAEWNILTIYNLC